MTKKPSMRSNRGRCYNTSMVPILQAPSDVLSQPAKPIAKVDKEIHKLIDEMKETLLATKDPEGVGLAASQVGRSLQLFIMKPSPSSAISVIMNPKISVLNELNEEKPKKKSSSRKLEGCLSLKDIWGTVKRSSKIEVEYLNEQGKTMKKIFTGFSSTIIQHEYDHLQGILFPKRVLEQKGQLYKSHKNEKGEDEFEEIDI